MDREMGKEAVRGCVRSFSPVVVRIYPVDGSLKGTIIQDGREERERERGVVGRLRVAG
jgi:hypothetical protein